MRREKIVIIYYFKLKKEDEVGLGLVGAEMGIRESASTQEQFSV